MADKVSEGVHVVYVTFTFWLFLILFAGMGVYRLWASMLKPVWVNWALLPGTFVAEMSYIFGALITGGEMRRVQLLPGKSDARRRGGSTDGEPVTEDAPRWKVVGPMVANLTATVGALAALVALYSLLDSPAIERFVIAARLWVPGSEGGLPRSLPTSYDRFWAQLKVQIDLLRGMVDSWGDLDWTDWRVPLFVYLAGCLTIRLAPVRRDLRWTLAAMVLIAALIALAGLISDRFDGLIREGRIWYFLTYLWTLLLLLLSGTLVLRGLIALARVLAGKADRG